MIPLEAPPSPAVPTRTSPRGTEPLVRLYDGPPVAGTATRGGLGGELAARYDGDLLLELRRDRPIVVANFVETIDGIVAMDTRGATGGGEVSGFSPTDRFVMGLLRSLADVVLIGASTVRASVRAARTPGGVCPECEAAFRALRAELGLAPVPTTLIVTSSGDLDPQLPAFQGGSTPIVIAAPPAAAARLRAGALGANVAIEPMPGAGPDALRGVIDRVARRGARVILSEAGPRLFAALTAAALVDDLFVTVAPQLAGRADGVGRLAMIEGEALWPAHPRWAQLRSVRRSGDHLFQRYHFEESR